MRIIRNVILCGLLAASTSVPLIAQEGVSGRGSSGSPAFPGGAGGYPGGGGLDMGSEMGMPGMSGIPSGPMKPKQVRRTVVQTIMVPISPEELAEGQEYQAAMAALRAEDRTPEQKAAAKEALAKLVEKQFDRDLETREKEVAELEARTKKLRQQFDKRKAAKAEIIALRLQTLQNEIDGLGFPSAESNASIPVPGGEYPGAPAYGRPTTGTPIGLPGPPSIPDDELRPNLPKKGLQPSDDNAATYPVNGPNLIRNGEFEEFDRQEDGAANWVHWVPQGSEHKRVAGQGIDGSAAFLIRNERLFSDSQSVMTQQINYTGDSPRIRFTAQVKCDTDAGKRVVIWITLIDSQGDAQDVHPDADPLHGNGEWCGYQCEAAIPKDTKKIIFNIGNKEPGDLWLDSLKAEYLDGSRTGILLKNPSFKDGPNGWGTGANPETVEYTVSDKGGVNETQAARIHKTADKYFPIAEWTQRLEYDGKSPAIELSAQVKTKDARKAVLDVLFLDDKDEWIKHEWAAYIGDQRGDPQPLTHDFQEYKGTVAIPPNTESIVIGLQDYGPGDVWFDDVKAVYRNELPQEPNNVP